MTTSFSAIETLFTNNIINYDTRASLIKRVERLEAKEESRKLVQGTADAIIELLDSEVQTETKYFSVKKTQNSVGFMDFVMTDRATVLKALTLLVSQDKIKKVGVVGGEVKLPKEVNAFQIRYTRA